MRNRREYTRRAAVLIVAATGLIICATPSLTGSVLAYARSAAPSWSFTGSLNTPRVGHTATLLPNGKVLVAGGSGQDPRAELYDPATGTWNYTGSLNTNRAGHTATLLHNGKVLAAGGNNLQCSQLQCNYTVLSSAELYDPAKGAWSYTGALAGGIFGGRAGHTATLLQSGKVLAAGGIDGGDFGVYTSELYDPATGTWSGSGRNNEERVIHTTTLLLNGHVLLAGACSHGIFCGGSSSNAELYNPATGDWSVTGALNTPRFYQAATGLPDGRVLITGGYYGDATFNSAEIYDPATGTWSAAANLNTPRVFSSATLLLNGKVLVAGGRDGMRFDSKPLLSAELYDSLGSSTTNPIDDPQFFTRQHYLDFLGREPDPQGLAFWTNEIESCGADAACREVKRVNVSAAFFLSIEFQHTGYLVYRMHKAAYGGLAGKPVPLRREEFVPDAQSIGWGVVVGADGWEQLLAANQGAFAEAFVARQRFTDLYPQAMPPAEFVARLDANTGGALTAAEADALAAELAAAGNSQQARASVLRRVAENAEFSRREFNRAFVLAQYFGYLRRNPDNIGFDGQPDPDFDGYNFWLQKLDQFGGDFVRAEMVKAFLSSIEYRRRFGQP